MDVWEWGGESGAGVGRAMCCQLNVEERGQCCLLRRKRKNVAAVTTASFYVNHEGQKGELGKWRNGRGADKKRRKEETEEREEMDKTKRQRAIGQRESEAQLHKTQKKKGGGWDTAFLRAYYVRVSCVSGGKVKKKNENEEGARARVTETMRNAMAEPKNWSFGNPKKKVEVGQSRREAPSCTVLLTKKEKIEAADGKQGQGRRSMFTKNDKRGIQAKQVHSTHYQLYLTRVLNWKKKNKSSP